MSYHINRDGRELGVYSLSVVREKIKSREFLATDHGWTPGMTGWLVLAEIVEVTLPPEPPPPPAPPALSGEPPPSAGEPNSDPATEASSAAEQSSVRSEPVREDGSADPFTASLAAKRRGRPRRRSKPANHLIPAILVTVFCCLPLGLPAIYHSLQVHKRYDSGDEFGAREASKKAKIWTRVALATGVIGVVIYIAYSYFGVTVFG